jgi:hypothetical protein
VCSASERIVAAATALVAEGGYDEELCRQAFAVVCDRFDRHLLPLYLSPQPWRPRMRAVAYAAARYCREHPAEIDFGIAAVSRNPRAPLGERSLRLHIGEIDSVRREMADPDRAPKAAAEFVVGAFLELVMRSHAAGSYEEMEAGVPQLVYRANELYIGVEAAEEELLIAQDQLRNAGAGETRTAL